MESVDFLGFRLKSGTMQPGDTKVRAIAEFITPKSVHDIRKFLGLTSFFRRFIPRYALVSEPLPRLTRRDTVFQWRAEENGSFAALKAKLTCEPVLQLYDPNAETELHTDTSTKGLAPMLLHKKGGEWHLLYCQFYLNLDFGIAAYDVDYDQAAPCRRLGFARLSTSYTRVTNMRVLVKFLKDSYDDPSKNLTCHLLVDSFDR
ncbi:hypothetical protein MRX96_051992 [Rhipicephalus microplus]